MKIRTSRILRLKIVSVILLCILSSISFGSDETLDNCSTKFKEVFSLLPGEVGEYEKAATYRTFSSNSLFDYVNGNAYYFFDHQFICLGVQEYRSDKQAMLLELYQFESGNGAQTIYEEETHGNLNRLAIGEDGSFENCYLAFYYTSYFVKLMCFDEWQGDRSADESKGNNSNDNLEKLARSIETVLIQQTEGYLVSDKKGKIAGQELDKKNNDIVLIGASYAKGWALGEVAGMRVLNKGVSGEQSFEMLSRFEEDVISVKPKAVIIWGFINDIHRSKRDNIEAAIARAKESFVEMVKLSKDNGIMPILATEVTIRARDSWTETLSGWVGRVMGKKSYQDYVNRHVMDVNQWIRDYAVQQDLLLLDLQPVISDKRARRKKEYATKDGTHISQRGYEKLTENARGVLERYFNSSPI